MNDQNEGTKEPSTNNLQPSLVPVKCVLCQGWGSFSYGKKICNGCQGKGYILVPAKEEKEAPHA